jgi:hypothetical protein
MTITRGIVAAATFAAVAVGAANPAWADPEMSGHYIKTTTNPESGRSATTDWYVTPCGDGCADVITASGTSRAQLVNGQWTMDAIGSPVCTDDSSVPDASTVHFTWDPDTLAGTADNTHKTAACGQPAGYTYTNNLQLTQARRAVIDY